MLKLKKLLATLAVGLALQPIPSILANIKSEKTIMDFIDSKQYFIKTSKNELKHFTNTDQEFLYLKEIKDLYGNDLYYIQFSKKASIITVDYYETDILDIRIDQKVFDQEIIYVPVWGLHYKKDGNLYAINNHKLLSNMEEMIETKETYLNGLEKNKLENKKIRDSFLNGTEEKKQISNFSANSTADGEYVDENFHVSNEVEYSWWFRHIYKYNLGYADGGLCEYIALHTLFTYNELFISPGFFSESELDKYFIIPYNSKKDINYNGFMRPRNWLAESDHEDSLVIKLWKDYNEYKDFQSGWAYWDVFNLFIKDKPILKGKKIDDVFDQQWSASFWHTSQPETYLLNNGVPVILTYVFKGGGHSIIIYGYDKKTQKYLTNFGWPDKEYSQVLLTKSKVWSTFSIGYWYAFKQWTDDKKTPLRKLFSYDGSRYSASELQSMGVISRW